MSGGSSSVARWCMRLEPVQPPPDLVRRPDDPRLGEITEFGQGGDVVLTPGRAVLIGFPQDEGVRRNGGRVGAAQAPHEIRRAFWRLTACDASCGLDLTARPPLDLGDIRIDGTLEQSQEALGLVVQAVLAKA